MEHEQVIKEDLKLSRWHSPRRVLIVFSLIGLLSMLIAAIALFFLNSGGTLSRRVFLGFGVFAVFELLYLYAGIRLFIDRNYADRLWNLLFTSPTTILRLIGILFTLAVLLVLAPSSWFGRASAFHDAWFPLLVAFTVTAGAAYFIVLVQIFGLNRLAASSFFQTHKRDLFISAAFLTGAIIIWSLVVLSGQGIHSNEDLWYGAGAPILSQQVLIGLLLMLIVSRFESRWVNWVKRITHSKVSPDLILFFLIWILTAALWMLPPVPTGFTAPRPLPPNHEIYPFADSARYDLGSQFALIGQGLNNGKFYYRVFYEAYLFILHALFGQQYNLLMEVQSVIFSVFPALIYLLGRALKNRPFGVMVAALAACSGFNSIIISSLVDVANPKQILTDFPTALGVVGFVLLTVVWWKKPERTGNFFWAAGVVGVATLVRTSAFVLLPLLLGLVWVSSPLRNWRRKPLLSVLAVFMFLASALPWSTWYGRFVGDMYSTKFQSMLHARYGGDLPSNLTKKTRKEKVVPPVASEPRISSMEAMTVHFAHNMVTSVLTMPPALQFIDLRSVVKEEFPYWDPQWNGSIAFPSLLFVLFNLIMLCLGLGAAIQASGWTGAVPLLVFLTFCGVDSLGRSSGGRYLAPMAWILLLYYAWGLVFVIQMMGAVFQWVPVTGENAPAQSAGAESATLKRILFSSISVFVILFGVSALMILWTQLVPKRYEEKTTAQLFDEFVREGYQNKTGFEESVLQQFLQQNGAGIWTGRALYPRYYLGGQGLRFPSSVYSEKEYPRLIFNFIGPQADTYAILPGPVPGSFPNAVDVIVLGCKTRDYIEALSVVVLTPRPHVYVTPSVAPKCPLFPE